MLGFTGYQIVVSDIWRWVMVHSLGVPIYKILKLGICFVSLSVLETASPMEKVGIHQRRFQVSLTRGPCGVSAVLLSLQRGANE